MRETTTKPRPNPIRKDPAYLRETSPARLKELADEIETLAFRLAGATARHHEAQQTRWLGGDSMDEGNHSVPEPRIRAVFAALAEAQQAIGRASHELCMHEIESGSAFRS